MAYTLPNTGILRPWNFRKNRYIHRKLLLTVSGTTASGSVSIPCPGRLVAISYGAPNATTNEGVPGTLTSGALTVKAETTAGVQIWTDGDLSSTSSSSRPVPVGTTSLDEGAAATAETDGFSGGFPVRQGVFASIASGTDSEVCEIDMWFRLCTYVKLDLVAQSGADGTGAVTRMVELGNAGVLAAIAIDYQNTPNTADLLIKADGTGGPTLHSRANSNTDLGPTLLGSPGADEAVNASAATDGTECGLAFRHGLFFDLAQTDIFTGGNEHTIIECWIDD